MNGGADLADLARRGGDAVEAPTPAVMVPTEKALRRA
jgi:hypothetical protein